MKNKKLIILVAVLILILMSYLFYSNFLNTEKYLKQDKTAENDLKISSKTRDNTINIKTNTALEMSKDEKSLVSEDLKEKNKSSSTDNIKKDNNKKEENEVLRKAIYTFKNERDPFFKDTNTEKNRKENDNKNSVEENIKKDKKDKSADSDIKEKSSKNSNEINKEQNENKEETEKIENDNKNNKKKIIEIPFVLKGIIGDRDKRYAVISYKNRTDIKKANEKVKGFLITKIKDSSIEIEYQDYKHEIFIWRHPK